jgi:hypothetical protein
VEEVTQKKYQCFTVSFAEPHKLLQELQIQQLGFEHRHKKTLNVSIIVKKEFKDNEDETLCLLQLSRGGSVLRYKQLMAHV